jgi:alkyl sulfatase BDS1-like metallo-beta-lactamase superfamily hydrolase
MTNLKTGFLLLGAFYLVGCQNNNSTITTNKDQKEASKYTLEANDSLYKSYPFDDKQSFTDATKGLIAVWKNMQRQIHQARISFRTCRLIYFLAIWASSLMLKKQLGRRSRCPVPQSLKKISVPS